MKLKKIIAFIIVAITLFVVSSCSIEVKHEDDYFTLWNDCESITALKEYVDDVTDKKSPNYIPVEDRIATFDMDGTFVGELYPSYFEYNMLEYRVLDDPDYKDIAPVDVKEVAQEIRDFVRHGVKLPDHFDMRHAYAAAEAYSGMTLKEFDDYVKAYAAKEANGFTGMTYGESFYKPMLEIFDYLEAKGFTYYVVSGSDRFICRALVDSLGIDPSRVIGMDVVLQANNQNYNPGVEYTMSPDEYLIRTNELIIKNLKTNKVKQIVQEIGKTPVLSFGNSGGDSAMHNFCLGNEKYKSEAFMLIADDEARDHANRDKALKLGEQWKKAGYHVISMRDDFKTIYGEGVEKTDFTFDVDTNTDVELDTFIVEAEKAPKHSFTTAHITYEFISREMSIDGSTEPNVIAYDSFTETATFDLESGEFLFEDDALNTQYSYYVNHTASLEDLNHSIYSDSIYQTIDVHYYVGDGYRFRFLGNGIIEVPVLLVNSKTGIEGVKVFNEYGLLVFEEVTTTVEYTDLGTKTVGYSRVIITFE